MELIQGGTIMVAASPALCKAAGARTLDAPVPSTDTREWYFRSGTCMLPFATDYLGLVTRATQGLDRDLLDPDQGGGAAGRGGASCARSWPPRRRRSA